jgi:di/tricarboxylate transporter
MLTPATITLLIIGGAAVLLLSNRVRPDLVALLVMLSLGLTGVLTPQETFSGFSRSAVITILAIFILAEGLKRTGVTDRLGSGLLKLAGAGEVRLTSVVTLAGALLSLFMNNIAAASVLLPAAAGAAKKQRLSPARLLIPLAFGTILGGMATLFTTTNLIASGLLRDQGLPGFGVLDFAPLGLIIVLIGIVYLMVWGRRLLPTQFPIQLMEDVEQIESNLAEVYRLKERLVRAQIPPGSPLAGKTIRQSGLREIYRLDVIAVDHNGRGVLAPVAEMQLSAGDVLLVAAKPEVLDSPEIQALLNIQKEEQGYDSQRDLGDLGLVEAVLSPRSELIGRTLRETHFREKFQASVIAIWRSGRPIRTGISDLALQFGDALLLLGSRQSVKMLHSDQSLIVLAEREHRAEPSLRKAWLAGLIMLASLTLAILNDNFIGEIMLAGAVLMVLAGVLSMDEAYHAIDWKSIFIIAGMLPLGIAMTKSGLASIMGTRVLDLAGPSGPQVLLASLVILTVLLSQIMHGAAVAAVMVPVGISAAMQVGIDARALTMGIALATSIAFITPFGHPVNILVMGPGGYQLRDYARVGLPLTLLVVLVVIFLLPLFWPLVLPAG